MQSVKVFDHLHKLLSLQTTLTRDSFTGLEKWCALAGDSATSPSLIYGGSEAYPHKKVRVVGWRESGELLDQM
jgi:hypothetical protein